MRPRVFPAEDLRAFLRARLTSIRFNEAAGIPRGRPPEGRANLRAFIQLQ